MTPKIQGEYDVVDVSKPPLTTRFVSVGVGVDAVKLVEDVVVSTEVTKVVVISVMVLDEAVSTELVVEVVNAVVVSSEVEEDSALVGVVSTESVADVGTSREVVVVIVGSSEVEEDSVLVAVATAESVVDVCASRGVVDTVVVSSKVEEDSVLVLASTELVVVVERSRDAPSEVVVSANGGEDVDELIDEISVSREVINAVVTSIDVLEEIDVSSSGVFVLVGTLVVEMREVEGCSLDVVGTTSTVVLEADTSAVLFC